MRRARGTMEIDSVIRDLPNDSDYNSNILSVLV